MTADRSRWIALYVLCLGMVMIVLDVTVVNVALPSIQDDLGFSTSSLAWVVNGYLISFGGLLLVAGRLGDLIGRRAIFLAGLALFTGASALCGLAQSEVWLVAARFVSASRTNHLAHAGNEHAQALTSAYHLAFLIAAGLVAAAIVVAGVVVQSEKRAAAATARAG